MNKSLEALNEMINKFVEILLETKCEEPTAVNITYLANSLRMAFHNELNIIETTLKDYDELTSKPVILYGRTNGQTKALIDMISKNYKAIKITNLDDQNELKALEIIKKKRVDVAWLYLCFGFVEDSTNEEECDYYNDGYTAYRNSQSLTYEEFNLLKKVLLYESFNL